MSSAHPTASHYHDEVVNEFYAKATSTLSLDEQDQFLRQMGNRTFDINQAVPLFWIPNKIAVDPDVVAGYTFPGNISGVWTHLYNIKAAG